LTFHGRMSASQETTGGVAVDEYPALSKIAGSGFRAQPTTVQYWGRSGLLLFVCSAWVLVVFRHTLLLMVGTWYGSRTYSHCFLILPLFFYLVWIRRDRIASLKPVPNSWGLPLLGSLVLVWVFANLGEVKIMQEFAMVAILVVLVWTLLGTAVVRALSFPLLFLFFAVPFGVSLIGPLRDFTTWFVIHALTLSNVPAVLENHILSLPSGVWTIAEACSGIRFLLSSVVLGTVFASIAYRSPKRRLVFMCASVAVPVIANGVRAYGIILLAYLTDNRVAAGVDHVVYGTLFYVFIQLVLIVVGLRWREKPVAYNQTIPHSARVSGAWPKENGLPGMAAIGVSLAALCLISLAPAVAAHFWNRATNTTGWADPPVVVREPWQVAAAYDMVWAPELRGADQEFRQSYTHERNRIDLYWALYSGGHGADLADSHNPPADFKPGAVPLGCANAIIDGQPTCVHRSLIESGRASRSVWTWYWVSGEYTASPRRVRFLQAKARFLGNPAEVAVIALGIDNHGDTMNAERVLQEFLLHASFPVTAGGRLLHEIPTADVIGLRP
jgi:exosortase A